MSGDQNGALGDEIEMATTSALLLGSAAAAALALVYYRRRAQSVGTPKKRTVAVASESKQKLNAAKAALNAEVVGIKAPSLIEDQPMGIDKTLRGAKNRLAALLDAIENGACKTPDLAVAIENGLMKVLGGEEETWIDVAFVVIRDIASGTESVSTSVGMQFPTAAVAEWAEDGEEGTVGQVLAERLKCDPQDPHAALTAQQFSREKLLEDAIKVAAATLAA